MAHPLRHTEASWSWNIALVKPEYLEQVYKAQSDLVVVSFTTAALF